MLGSKTPLGEMDAFRGTLRFFCCSESMQFLILNYFSQLLFNVTGNPP